MINKKTAQSEGLKLAQNPISTPHAELPFVYPVKLIEV